MYITGVLIIYYRCVNYKCNTPKTRNMYHTGITHVTHVTHLLDGVELL